ncbi:hypothetical protein BEN49_03665 [Hymenobacter coccineus]|uniref:Secretion system C-terminal sorting domain-containing protein n=1 Tax=Hymenobacter coccineus TaxID=1908235 RepID=A0A1G1TMN0_9BACT|nr:hypothetical protein BEN49_03665 [Hymenobacter coccineus]
MTIQGTLTINTGCTYLPGTNTTIFSGGQDQLLANNGSIGTTADVGTFNNLTMNKSGGTLTLGGTVMTYATPATGTLALVSGVLNDGGKTINVAGALLNSASHTSGGGQGSITLTGTALQTITGDGNGIFGNLNISNATTPVAVQLGANTTISNYLTFLNDAVFAIKAYRLAITNVDMGAISTTTAFSKLCMIQTTGNQSDLGLQKTFGGADTFVYPVGVGTKYMPATIQLAVAVAIAKYGQVSVSPTNTRNPFTTTANALPYYWKVRSVGFGPLPTSSVNLSFTMNNADASGAGTYTKYVPGRYNPVAWTTSTSNNIQFGSAATANSIIRFRSNNQFDGEFTAGEPAAFGTVTAFYSRATGNWEAPATWSTTGYGGAAAATVPGAGNPVFIGSASNGAYHTVTLTASGAKSGSLVIDRGSTLDVGTTGTTTASTNNNFGALPDSKIGGSGRLRISSTFSPAVFPDGDFGSFIQYGGGTVEYYTTGTVDFTLPTASGTLTLNQYRNLWLNAATGRTITLPNQDLRVYAQLKAGTASTFPGTVLVSSAAAGNLRADSLLAVQAGIFRLQGTTPRTLSFDTDVQVATSATFDVLTNAAQTHSTSVGGSLTNNGTLDFKVGTGLANLIFTSSQNATFTSAGPTTDLATLTLNKGLGRTALLSLDGAGTLTTPTNGWLTLTNGTLRYAKPNATLNIHDGVATPYLITDNAGLTVDASGCTVTVATNNNAAADLKLAGQLQILQGTLKVGAAGNVGNDLEYASAGAPGLQITAGNLYVNGQIRRTVANLDGSLRFDQSGGTIDIDGQGASAAQNNERGLFEVQGKGSIFRMSAGTLNLHRSNQKSPILTADLYLAPDSTVVTGGTVVLGNPTTAPIGSSVTVSINSTVPLYDLRIESGASGNTNTGLLAGVIPLTLKGSLTIGNNFSFFNANGLGLNIYQNLLNNNTSASTALNAGGFQPITTTQTTSFLGGLATQQLTGTASNLTVFGSLVVNTPQTNGTLQLGGNVLTTGTLMLTKGTLDDNGKTITAQGDVLNYATHLSGGSGTGSLVLAGTANQTIGGDGKGRFGNVNLNNTAGASTTANQEITKVLTMTNGVLTIGSNLLWLSNPAAGAVTGFGTTRFIRTNGIVADLGLRKSYPSGALDFTFPVGAAAKYTPVRMNVAANSAAGTLMVQPIDLAHPSTTDPAAKELGFYWKVSSTGFSSPTVSQVFTYIDNGVGNDVNGTEANYKLGRFLDGAWTPQGGIAGSVVSTTANTLSASTTYFDGDYTGGEASEFGAVPTFYSRNATASLSAGAIWTDAAAWTYNTDGTDSSPLPTTFPTLANPVVIRSGHLITSGSAGRGAATLRLDGTLDLGPNAANNFNTVSGNGTVRIGSALFPAGNYSTFMAPSGGTVDYSGAVQLPARDTYNNLTFSGGNAKQLSNLDLTINGALTVGVGTTVDNPTSQNINLTSATSGATVSGTLNLNDGALTTGASLTTTTGGELNLGVSSVSIGTTFANGGTLNNGSGNVTVGTAFSNSGTYNANVKAGNLTVGTTFANSGSYTGGVGTLVVNSNFSNTTSGTLTVASGDVNVLGSFSNAGTYTAPDPSNTNYLRVTGDFFNLANSYFAAASSTIILHGNFSNSGDFDTSSGSSLAVFTTDNNRTLNGTTTFYNLQKAGAKYLMLGTNTNVTVINMLTMRNGLIYTGTSNILSLSNATMQPIVGASTTSYVAGRLAMALPDAATSIRVFPVGLGSRYRPVTITPQAASTSPVVLAEIINAAPAGSLDATLSNMSANRYYRIQLLSGTLNEPTVQLSFNTDVEDEEVHVPGNLRVAISDGASGPWSTAGGAGVFSPADPRGYTASASALTTINSTSFFALASTNKVDNPLTGTPPVTLPVKLVQFTAVRLGAAVQVAWATASEQNSAYFMVQRSADGRTFTDLERVAAQGTTTSRHNYVTLDTAPLPGLSYYRMRQVDIDNQAHYSPVVAVRFDGAALTPALVAYPNPATGSGFRLLATNLPPPGGTVQVFDNVGRLVLTHVAAAGTAEATIKPRQPLASGLYFVTWQTADGLKLTTKVAVE